MIIRTFKVSLTTLLLAAGSVKADEVCTIKAVVRCSCPASMMVACASGRNGLVDDEERAKSITVSMVDPRTGKARKVELNDPPEGIRTYYGTLIEDPWIVGQLGARGFKKLDELNLDVTSIRFGDDVTLYDDPNKKDAATGE